MKTARLLLAAAIVTTLAPSPGRASGALHLSVTVVRSIPVSRSGPTISGEGRQPHLPMEQPVFSSMNHRSGTSTVEIPVTGSKGEPEVRAPIVPDGEPPSLTVNE
jgi:hypothetical protein